jgi:hypothetical protein
MMGHVGSAPGPFTIAESLRGVAVMAPGEGSGVDRGVDRHPENSLCRVCVHGINARHWCRSRRRCERACFF